ncbi:MAG: L,D-transpeptidase family protein [Methylobacteriaceae bacterium]|nr:L,D-transpeptidase family protein [Methylobacteriaceae bacterium]
MNKALRMFTALAAVSVITLAGVGRPASAQTFLSSESTEWKQDYDSGAKFQAVRSSTPVLSKSTVASTEQTIAFYRDLVARGGWPTINVNPRLKVGSRSKDVVTLRNRLIAGGDLDPSLGQSPVYDSYVETAVKRFQNRHGLRPVGYMTPVTLASMNVPAETRLKQLEVNLVRLRSHSGNLGNRYVIVNIPAAVVETVEDGVVHSRHDAGVGKEDRQSPIMDAKITQINFNPFWTVPSSIIKKDLIPLMREQPTYLAEHKIRIFNHQGKEMQASQVDWNSNEAMNYMFRQDPGGDVNSMGFVRINIPNPYGVYMHDTPAQGVFGDDFRFVSSGCVRVQNVRGYIEFLLARNEGWDKARIERTFESGERVDVTLSTPVPVYWTYITAWATPDGLVNFRNDIYNRDGIAGASVAMMEQDQLLYESEN